MSPAELANPFCSARVRPGAIPYLWGDDCHSEDDADAALDRLWEDWRSAGSVGSIVGPHGAGKSTLLRSLRRRWAERGGRSWLVRPPLDRRSVAKVRRAVSGTRPRVLLIDGWEALPASLQRAMVRAQRAGGGLLVTSHCVCVEPVLRRIQPTVASTLRVIDVLAPGWKRRPTTDDLAGILARHGLSVRETLFELYDRWEMQRLAGASATECPFSEPPLGKHSSDEVLAGQSASEKSP